MKYKKCWLCKKEIKEGEWCWNGLHHWHEKCKRKDTEEKIQNYLKKKQVRR